MEGIIDLEKLQLTPIEAGEAIFKVRRTPDNKKVRPNEQHRHNPFVEHHPHDTDTDFVNSTDLEWMSFNYRKTRAASMSPSKRRMILVMFEEDYQYFPSVREIRDGIVKA